MKTLIFLALIVAANCHAAAPTFSQFFTNDFATVNGVSVKVNTNTIATVAAQVAGDTAISTNLFVTNGAIVNGRFYSDLQPAFNAAGNGQMVELFGTITITNQVSVTNGQKVVAYGALILNANTNLVGPLSFGIFASKCDWSGGTITNLATNSFQVGFGFDYRAGHMGPHSVSAKDLTVWGNSDAFFFFATNSGNRVKLVNCDGFSGWDTLVVGSPDSMMEVHGGLFNPYFLSVSGAPCALKVAAGNHVFHNVTFKVNATNANSIVLIDPDSTFHPTITSTNLFYGCRITGSPSNNAAGSLMAGITVASGSLGETAQAVFKDGLIDFDTTATPGFSGALVLNTGSSLFLYDTVILANSTNTQVDVTGVGANKRAYLGGANNVVSNRISGASQNVRIVYSGGDVGTAFSYVPRGWFTNLTTDTLSASNTTLNGVTTLPAQAVIKSGLNGFSETNHFGTFSGIFTDPITNTGSSFTNASQKDATNSGLAVFEMFKGTNSATTALFTNGMFEIRKASGAAFQVSTLAGVSRVKLADFSGSSAYLSLDQDTAIIQAGTSTDTYFERLSAGVWSIRTGSLRAGGTITVTNSNGTNSLFGTNDLGTFAYTGTLRVTNIFSTSADVPVAVTVGASPFNFTNNTAGKLECYFSGATAYAVDKNGVAIYGSLAGDAYFTLNPSSRCTITYTVAPSMFTNSW